MKLRILTLTAVTLLLVACGTTKTVAEAAPSPPPPPKAGDAKELTTEYVDLAEAKNLYENSCARCHKLYDPKKYTKEEWAPILVRMGKKAKLDETQLASVTSYIHSQL